jgi:hypothetical protein
MDKEELKRARSVVNDGVQSGRLNVLISRILPISVSGTTEESLSIK